MRTPTMPARGTRDVWTGEFYPSNQARFDSFTNSATLLCAWRMPGRMRPTFAQPDLELWARRDAGAEVPDIDLPVYLGRADVAVPYGSELFCLPDDRGLGPRDVLELSGVRSRVVLPDSDGRPYYAVATLPADADGPVEIVWDGVFAPRRAKLEPGRAVLFRAPAPRLWASVCEEASVRLRKSRGATGARVAVTADPGLAAHWLRDAGDPKAAFDLLSSLDCEALDDAARYEGALAAEAIDVEPPAEWATAAAKVRGRIETARAMLAGGAPRSTVSVCGVPLDVLDELGTMRNEEFGMRNH